MFKLIIFITNLLLFIYKKALIETFAKTIPLMVKKIEFSMVNIYNLQRKNDLITPVELSEFLKSYLLKDKKSFFKASLGSGFIIDEYFHIITNFHVIENAENISVTIGKNDKYRYKAKIVGKDKKTDLALLKIDNQSKLKFIKLGDSDVCKIGEKVIAVGNSFGFESTVTTGIISAKERKLGKYFYEEFIQTDAPINKGNSGGPMINLRGEVIGVNSAIISPNGGNIGIGFAIPSNTVKYIISKLFIHGKVYRPWMGIKFEKTYIERSVDRNILNIPTVKIKKVIKGSPAEKAGLKSGDLIISYNNIKIKINTNFTKIVSNTSIKNDILVKIFRKKNILTYQVKLEIPKKKYRKTSYKKIMFLGMTVAKVDKNIIVTNILNSSISKKRGIKIGDIILSINKNNIDSLITLNQALKYSGEKKNTLLIVRQKQYFFVTI